MAGGGSGVRDRYYNWFIFLTFSFAVVKNGPETRNSPNTGQTAGGSLCTLSGAAPNTGRAKYCRKSSPSQGVRQMVLRLWKWLRALRAPRLAGKNDYQVRFRRPRLERLEERICPTNYDYNIIASTA